MSKKKNDEEAYLQSDAEAFDTNLPATSNEEHFDMEPAGTSDAESFLMEASQEEDDGLARFPRLSIDQKGKEATIGSLRCKEMAEEFETITAVLLKEDNSRILWPEDYDPENEPICRSHDGVLPVQDDKTEPMADKCKNCTYSQWGKDGKTPPMCKEVKDLLIMDTSTYIPMWFSVSSLALSPTKNHLLQPLKLRKMSLTAKRSNMGLAPAHSCMFSFDLTTVLKETKKGDAYIPVYSNITQLSQEEQNAMVQIAMQVRDAKAHNSREDDEQPEHEGDDF